MDFISIIVNFIDFWVWEEYGFCFWIFYVFIWNIYVVCVFREFYFWFFFWGFIKFIYFFCFFKFIIVVVFDFGVCSFLVVIGVIVVKWFVFVIEVFGGGGYVGWMLLYDVFIFIFENCLVIIYKVVEYMLKCLFKILVEFFIYDGVNKRVNVIVDKFKEMGI